MARTLHSLLRKWRFAFSGVLTALLLFSFTLLSPPPLNSDTLWEAWMARYGPPSSSAPPLIEEIGLARFLNMLQEEAEAEGSSIRLEDYVVPPGFGEGTKANLYSQNFSRLVIGRGYNYIDLPVSAILSRPPSLSDPSDSNEAEQEQEGGVFNPAILKMPEGMKKGWEYIVVARGPRVVRKDIWVEQSNRWAVEHGLVAFPATFNPSTNQFHPSFSSSRPKFLPIATERNNTSCGHWMFPFGAEDPRLYWTDEGRPAMSLSMNAWDTGEGGRCRSVGWVDDLRDVWEELRDAMSGVDERLAKPWPKAEMEEPEVAVKELWHDQAMANMEKNWMGFFPGPHKNSFPPADTIISRSTLPNFHYSLVPARVLVPPLPSDTTTTLEKKGTITYSFLTPSSDTHQHTATGNDPAQCISRRFGTEFPDILHRIHHATPLYRFTLCGRREARCVPNAGNTVMLGLGQVKWVYNGGQRYWRFFVLWNVTEPFDYLAIGPMIRWYETPDEEVVYAMSLVYNPTVTSRNSTTVVSAYRQAKEVRKNAQSLRDYGPTHGFLDDDIHVTLGLRDNEMGSLVMSGWEALLGMEMCL